MLHFISTSKYSQELTYLLKIASWAGIAALALLSLLPAENLARTGVGVIGEHSLAYAGVVLLVGFAYGIRQRLVWLGVLMTGYASILEMLQTFSPGRNPKLSDFSASCVGIVSGIMTLLLLRSWSAWRPDATLSQVERK